MEISKFDKAQALVSLKPSIFIIIIIVFCPRAGLSLKLRHKTAVLPKGRSYTANSGNKIEVLLGMNRCGSFPLLSAPHSLFSI